MVQVHVRAPVSKPLCLQQLQGEFRKLVFVGASPTRGSSLRLSATAWQAIQDCGVTSSISPCEGDGPGANPGFLTNF